MRLRTSAIRLSLCLLISLSSTAHAESTAEQEVLRKAAMMWSAARELRIDDFFDQYHHTAGSAYFMQGIPLWRRDDAKQLMAADYELASHQDVSWSTEKVQLLSEGTVLYTAEGD